MIIVCHYDEIALKGKNRLFFERVLIENIKNKINREISPDCFEYVKRISGRIIIKARSGFNQGDFLIIGEVPGVTGFAFAQEEIVDIEKIQEACWKMLAVKEFETFRVTASRSEKNFFLNSTEINREIGAFIVKKSGKKVRLKGADIEIFIELVNNRAFIYTDVFDGMGGLPVGSAGRALVLLSGGIDSPVAAYFALKRGVRVDFIHFHSMPYTSQASNDKVVELVRVLNKFQNKATIFMVPLARIQKEVVLKCPEKLRIILYRRMMFRIAEAVAKKNRQAVIYTGEAVSQVASQTLENICAVNEAIRIPVLRPLAGFNKLEIIKKAQEIGTYSISILPHEDCCTRFMPKNPETKGKINEIFEAEKKIDIVDLVCKALSETEIFGLK